MKEARLVPASMVDVSDENEQARARVRTLPFTDERTVVESLVADFPLDAAQRAAVAAEAAALIERLRDNAQPGLMERFLAEYGLGTDEGVALMCLAEAYLRTPDAASLDALITDKIGAGDWSRHRGKASSSLINASTWALMLTGRVFKRIPAEADDIGSVMHKVVQRLGEPVARTAVGEAMRVLGRQFVLGETIEAALKRGAEAPDGVLHSFDMLGEAARTADDAERYFLSYSSAIAAIAKRAKASDPQANPGISIKLSALHPRYESTQYERVMAELVPRVSALAEHAKAARIGFNIDAEEADRLDLSLAVIEAVLRNRNLRGWTGFGIVVQAYAKAAPAVIDWFAATCRREGRRGAVRLVKGAYWDTEIKLAQTLGQRAYPVFTRKPSTDVSYLACAKRLFDATDCLYPQFATHNAHSVCGVRALAPAGAAYEFQRLHGMGEALHQLTAAEDGIRRRVYAPVGVHEDLLAYLVRRLLENGANSSFVHQLLDDAVPAEKIARDPLDALMAEPSPVHARIPLPVALYGEERANARGWNLFQPADAGALDAAMAPFKKQRWCAAPSPDLYQMPARDVLNPSLLVDRVGSVADADPATVSAAVDVALRGFAAWSSRPVIERTEILDRAAMLYEKNAPELIALAAREAGKTRADGVAEVREAVDFLRYYAAEARRRLADGASDPRGPILCISPWNFPLAIFTGQIAAALAAGNSVIAKPAEQTPLIATRGAALLYEAGLPPDTLVLVPGDARVGRALTGDPRLAGICFTGSVETARAIDVAMAKSGDPTSPLVAETGGLNAMIVDTTALAEQAVRDIVASAFQSAGQRCSALRLLCVQVDVADKILTMLEGAVRELKIGDPWDVATDIGPVIDLEASEGIEAYCRQKEAEGRLLFKIDPPTGGTFVGPHAFKLDRVDDLEREIFGPVLHVVTYKSSELDAVIDAINAKGYGLTLGIHSRIDNRVDHICERAKVGNIYVNRNQIGAIVGVQPFGGEGLSGTGPKAGGPHYVTRFTVPAKLAANHDVASGVQAFVHALPDDLQGAARSGAAHVETGQLTLPGPTGEHNTYRMEPRGCVLCLGPSEEDLAAQIGRVLSTGNRVAMTADAAKGAVGVALAETGGKPALVRDARRAMDAQPALVLFDGDASASREIRLMLADRNGPRIPLITAADDPALFFHERVISEDTTAAGGNASLLAASG